MLIEDFQSIEGVRIQGERERERERAIGQAKIVRVLPICQSRDYLNRACASADV